MKFCSLKQCQGTARKQGWCEKHYARWRKYGSTELPPPKTLEVRFWEKVDKSGGPDACWLWTAATSPRDGYGRFGIGRKVRLAHRVSYTLAQGDIPEGFLVDHTCFNRMCVNQKHLRLATYKQNCEHQSGAYANSKTGVRGVIWDKDAKKYKATVGHNKASIYIGLFENLHEAAEAAKLKRIELFTHNDKDQKS